jgi:hypothetical protein
LTSNERPQHARDDRHSANRDPDQTSHWMILARVAILPL